MKEKKIKRDTRYWNTALHIILDIFVLLGFYALMTTVLEFYNYWFITLLGVIYGIWWLNKRYDILLHIKDFLLMIFGK